ncbi:acetylcholine receptor subunit delta-like [Saccostrea cucullata]|uniref:acetylcholine receptor subunit delta-like n=1 Tax=Saccostrea cuccullata TaxID=36930 RepID=UPI002ECFB31F
MSMAIFLTFAVYATLLSETMPSSADDVPAFSAYLITQIILSALTVMAGAIVISIYHKNPEKVPEVRVEGINVDYPSDEEESDKDLFFELSCPTINVLRVPAEKIWVPMIISENELESKRMMTFESVKSKDALVFHDGFVLLYDTVKSTIQCEITLLKYPFDEQTCSYKFDTPGYLNIEISENRSDFMTSKLQKHGEWSFVSSELNIQKGQGNNTFTLHIRRRPHMAILTTVIPIVLLSIMNIFYFVIPVEAGEKIGMSMAVFLTFAVYANLLSETMPSSADNVSVFSAYVITQIIISALTVMGEAIIIFIHHKTPEKVPKEVNRTNVHSPNDKEETDNITFSELNCPKDDTMKKNVDASKFEKILIVCNIFINVVSLCVTGAIFLYE